MRKYTEKKSRNSVNENSSKVRKNTSLEERWQNYAKHRQSQSYTYTQNSIITNTEKYFKISKKQIK